MIRPPKPDVQKSKGPIKRDTKLYTIVSAVIVVACLAAFPFLYDHSRQEAANTAEETQTALPPTEEEPVRIQIACVGDVMVHKSQIPSQYDSATETYDYRNNFQYVKPYIEAADLALCNVETTFAGKPYTGYPTFSAPDELAAALADTGFDVAITANNHCMDRGKVGLLRTLDVLTANGMITAGGRMDETAPRFAIAEVSGLRVGVVAYTYAGQSDQGDVLVNGSAVSTETASLLNYFRYDYLDEDLEKVKENVQAARNAGSDIVLLYFHWGEEYQLSANQWQHYIAEKAVNEMDVDAVFASHPHTLQEKTVMFNEHTGKQVPVFFSMGNFLSNQREETLSNRYTEIGMIALVNFTYDKNDRKILSAEMEAIPTWVEKYRSGGKDIYAVIPLDQSLDANEALAASGHLARAKRAWEDANGILGEN